MRYPPLRNDAGKCRRQMRRNLLLALLLGSAGAHADPAALPVLAGARLETTNPAAVTTATFAAGLSIDGGLTHRTTALDTEQLQITGYIRPEAAQIGQPADLYIVALIDGNFVMRLANGAWAAWNGHVPDLLPWRTQVPLAAENAVDVFAGRIAASGTYEVFLGYRAADGMLRYTPAPQRIDISTAAAARWDFNGITWQANGTPPACPAPLLTAPVDLARVSSILYPGQTRGGDYKAHGGFRFDGGTQGNAVNVTAAMSGVVYRAARYVEAGQLQYLFDIVHPCGVMLRYDHLRELSPKFAAIAATLPAATASTQTTPLSGHTVSVGDSIATAVGFTGNVAVDFGVYDLRSRNATGRSGELAGSGICWFDALPAADALRIRALPAADGNTGTASDYCR